MTLTEIARLLHRLADTQANLPVPLAANERAVLRTTAAYLETRTMSSPDPVRALIALHEREAGLCGYEARGYSDPRCEAAQRWVGLERVHREVVRELEAVASARAAPPVRVVHDACCASAPEVAFDKHGVETGAIILRPCDCSAGSARPVAAPPAETEKG